MEDLLNSISFDIIVGDFNINAFNENTRLVQTLCSYDQIVKESTLIADCLLDHGYIHNELLRELNIGNKVANVYFSDHDAVLIQFVRSEYCSDGLQPNGIFHVKINCANICENKFVGKLVHVSAL